ncbi:unnamed protein product [Chondrus crispus]|uniref:Uncharacterized protein n=1 Tax=Chondrus crispus TaxID=2769 RepID=R7Q5J7_CHOCR|nr:unnamed protein product [Chondrus crispus]CDF33812.1 unnamed protein product [Chondrus crispus]|eukprot:XP_005713631.1 unnamed protein product [Chondrus crispus]
MDLSRAEVRALCLFPDGPRTVTKGVKNATSDPLGRSKKRKISWDAQQLPVFFLFLSKWGEGVQCTDAALVTALLVQLSSCLPEPFTYRRGVPAWRKTVRLRVCEP